VAFGQGSSRHGGCFFFAMIPHSFLESTAVCASAKTRAARTAKIAVTPS
jgi:hypothetical protein